MAGLGVLVRPAAFALLSYVSVGRVAGAAFPVVFVVVVADGRGFAAAAFLQGLMVVAFAGTAPLRARILDRFGSRTALVPQTVVYLTALCGLTAATVTSTTNNILVAAFALVTGIAAPALDPAVRLSWQKTARNDEEKKVLHVADSLLEEAGFFIGPIAASVLMLTTGLASSFVGLTAIICVNNVAILATPAVRRNLLRDRQPVPESDAQQSRQQHGAIRRLGHLVLGPIARPDLREIVSPLIIIGTSFGLLAIAIPSIMSANGSIASSGFVTAAISAGGVVGGLVYGAMKLKGSLWKRQALLSLAFGIPILFVLFTQSPIALAVVLAVAGLAVTPLYINSYLLIDDSVSANVKYEANSWVAVGNDVGYVVGIIAGGLLINQFGFDSALLGVSVVGAILVIVATRGILRHRTPAVTARRHAESESIA